MKLTAFAILAALAATPALAQGMADMPGMKAAPAAAAAQTGEGVGVVKALNAKAGSVTLRHGPIPALGWPAMTMEFKADPALLANIKPGQTVSFTVKPTDESGEITAISPK
jgi:Cu(I)/Ag(I) efflux system protein CusF